MLALNGAAPVLLLGVGFCVVALGCRGLVGEFDAESDVSELSELVDSLSFGSWSSLLSSPLSSVLSSSSSSLCAAIWLPAPYVNQSNMSKEQEIYIRKLAEVGSGECQFVIKPQNEASMIFDSLAVTEKKKQRHL